MSNFIKELCGTEISIFDFPTLKIGHSENLEAATGCTVLISERGMTASVDVRGGGPASRETTLLNPLSSAEQIHSIVLSGGSAFGLEASSGVMEFLEQKGIGFPTAYGTVPLVCQSCIYDLGVGSAHIRPDKNMGYLACENAYQNHRWNDGNIGAGTGATVGKTASPAQMMKSGLGTYAIQYGDLKIGAIAVVNALGDIYDIDTNEKIAGVLNPERTDFLNGEIELCKQLSKTQEENLFANTTLGIVITNGTFRKNQLQKVASCSHNGFARTIRPVHTSADGDSIYAVSTNEVEANLDLVSILAPYVMGKAINQGVYQAKPAYGLLSAQSFLK